MQTVFEDQLEGKTLGDYQIERLLGHGKISAVYMAQQLSQNRTVMITTFNIPESLSTAAHERFIKRFTQVGSSLVTLNHPHILPIYNCGVQYDSPYLVTSFVKGGSLAQVLKQQPRFSPEQALDMLKQIADGLDYAHSQGIVHGLLNPANILVINEQFLQVTGFGLKQMLQMQGINDYNHPQAHLFSIAGTFLGAPEYIAPECVLGSAFDARADVYALGIMLFELLSGSPPFTGKDPLEVATKRLQQPVPSFHEMCPDLPAAYDLVFYLALEPEPEKRYKHAGELVRAFERVLKVLEGAAKDNANHNTQTTMHSQITLPPTVNWFDEEVIPTRKWQFTPPVVTGPIAAVQGNQQAQTTFSAINGMQQDPDQEQAVRLVAASENQSPVDSQNPAAAATDPFVWWSATSATSATSAASAKTSEQTPGTFARSATKRPTNYNANHRRKASVRERRQVVVGLLTGTAVVGILGIGGISFARFIESTKQLQAGNTQSAFSNNTSNSSSAQATQGTSPAATHGSQQTPTVSKTSKAQPSPTQGTPGSTPAPGSTPQPQPTSQPTQPPPTPTPTPPQHTGTVIGSKTQATNTAVSFTNPADGQASWLVHMSNGNFVAVEQACTHAGVAVRYDQSTGQFNCPAHGAIFNADGSNPQAPANRPLPSVSIRVNPDGTITTG